MSGTFLWYCSLCCNELYLSVGLFTMLHKVVLGFESADEILKWYHSNESY